MSAFESKYAFIKLSCYIPAVFQNLEDWQRLQQKTVQKFKDGLLTDGEMEVILKAVKQTKQRRNGEWVITFIPASTNERYEKKYRKLTDYLRENQDIPVAYFGIGIKQEGKCKHLHGGGTITANNLYIKNHLLQVKNKYIILIDDVITTGKSFRTVGDYLIKKGASRVYGIIFAMTIHPNLPRKGSNYCKYNRFLRK